MTNAQNSSRVRTTKNAHRYQRPSARVKLSPQGRPVAFRRVTALSQQPGSFAVRRYQIVKPTEITAVSPARYRTLAGHCYPLN